MQLVDVARQRKRHLSTTLECTLDFCATLARFTTRERSSIALRLRAREWKATLGLVRHRALPHWVVIFFLVSRLIFGEFAHAMPHELGPSNADAALASEASSACPDHKQPASSTHDKASGSDATKSGDHSGADRSTHEKDCCKKGGCVCPCLHTPAALSASAAAIVPSDQSQPGVLANGAARLRSSALFRPPA